MLRFVKERLVFVLELVVPNSSARAGQIQHAGLAVGRTMAINSATAPQLENFQTFGNTDDMGLWDCILIAPSLDR